MAYNNYFPATYQPYQQSYYQPVQQIQQPVQQVPQPSSLIWVGSFAEAQMYPVAPNAAVALWDSSSPAIYLKQADASGRPTLKTFDLVERVESPAPQEEKAVAYATKDDLASFKEALDAVKGDIETMRGDIYGIAGKRKAMKKAEEEE